MKTHLDRTGSIEALQKALDTMEGDSQVQGIMVLAAEGNGWSAQEVDPVLAGLGKPVWGGVFPQLLFGKENLTTGTVVVGVERPVKTLVMEGISGEDRDLEEDLEPWEEEALEDHTMFVFMDGLSSGVNAVKDSLFDCLGLAPNYIGGGAGSLTFVQQPCIMTNGGLLQDAAVLALVELPSGIGVAHGWQPVSEPMKITESDRNRIISINWEPAFQAYRKTVEPLAKQAFNENNFFDIAKGHPFGIIKMANEMVVRDPIEVTADDVMVCVGEVPVNSFVYVLQGDTEGLVKGALEARRLAEKSLPEEVETVTFFIDCISRVLFMEEDFVREMETVYRDGPLLGALTLGEIANTGKSFLEFYNKTSVVGLMPVAES